MHQSIFASAKKIKIALLTVFFLSLSKVNHSQIIQWSTYLNSTGNDFLVGTAKDAAGDVYVLGTSNANGFPVTAGAFQPTLTGNTQKLTISKLSGLTGNLIWSTYLGGDNDVVKGTQIYWDAVSNTINVSAATQSSNFPVVNGNPKLPESIYSPILAQFNATTGALLLSTHVFNALALNNNGTAIEYRTEFRNGFAYYFSLDVTLHSVLVSKINLSTSQFVYQKAITGNNGLINSLIGISSIGLEIDNGEVYLSGATSATDFPTTPGSYQPVFPVGEAEAYFITRLNASGNIVFSTYANPHPVNSYLLFQQLAVSSNMVAFGQVFNNGAIVSPGGLAFDNNEDVNLGLLKLNKANGSLNYFTYLGGNSIMDAFPIRDLIFMGNDLIVYGNSESPYLPVTPNAIQPYNSFHIPNGYYAGDAYIIHFNAANQIVYCSYLGGNESENIYVATPGDNNTIYFSGLTNSNNFPVTANATQSVNKGSVLNTPGELFITKYNLSSRSITYSSYLGTNIYDSYTYSNGKYSVVVDGENVLTLAGSNYFQSQQVAVDYPVSADAFQSTIIGNVPVAGHQYFGKINTITGKLEYGSYIASLPTGNGETSRSLLVNDNNIYLGGETSSNDYPVTQGAVRNSYLGNSDIYITKLMLCYDDVKNDTLIPHNQLVCAGSVPDTIVGSVPQLANTPVILRNGVAQSSQENQTNFIYQWQESNDSIAWTFINGATEKDYLPGPTTEKKYFRRIAKPAFCDYTDTSSVAVVDLSTAIAIKPDVGSDGSFFACQGSNITLGTPAVAGFTYSWSPATHLSSNSTAQTIFNNPVAGAYTYVLAATGPNGCTGRDTATVFNYAANAGPDKVLCQGQPIQIGSMPLSGLTGVTYSWAPSAGLSCSSCSQPVVSAVGTYTLTVNVPLPTGGNCITTDAVAIAASTLPNDPGGPDVTTCNALPVVLGTPRVAGYTYNWAPGILLSAIADTAQPVYNHLNATVSPLYNPIKYTLTASNPAGCTIVDTVKVYVVDVDAGKDGCRPLQLGKRDRTGGQATYQWVIFDGVSESPVPAGELSSTTIPNPVALANASITMARNYRLKMTWNGVTCTDDVTVTVNCTCPAIILKFKSNTGCPTVNGLDSVTIYVWNPNPDYTYSWTPATGLNTTVGPIVKTGATSSIIYTCTATNIYDPTVQCSESIKINFFNVAAPEFEAPDKIICKNTSTNIGLPTTAGWDYYWTSSESILPFNFTSDPTVTGVNDISYYVEVTDQVTGCYTNDTVKVKVPNIPIEAGPNRPSCSGGGFSIGTPAVSGLTYQWIPSTGLDNASVAQPMVISNDADITYILVVTDPLSGCNAIDVVSLIHTNTPFLDTIIPPAVYCSGSNTSVQIGNLALNGVTYSWSPATNLNNPNIAQPIANPTVTTTYTLTATFSGTCASTATQTVTVTVTPKPTAVTSVTNNCVNSQLNVTTNATNPFYYWNPLTNLDNPYIANPVSTSSVPVTYTVTVNDLATGCTNSSTVTVLPPLVANAGSDKELCTGNTVQIGSSPEPGVSYSWLPATGLTNYNTANPLTLSSLPAGTYTYAVTATSGGCTKTDNVIVKINPLPNVGMNNGVTICKNASIQIGVTPQAGISYSWSPATGLSNTSVANPIATPLTTTTYTVIATNIANNCTAQGSTTVTVNTTGAPSVNAVAANNSCPGDPVQLNANVGAPGSYTYVWSPTVAFITSPFINNPIVAPMATTVYNVLVTNTVNGCSNTASATVTVKDTCNIVPVSWLSFSATLQNAKTQLRWVVAMEQNNKEFIAERSIDGINWIALFHVPSLGNTNSPRTYNGIDANPATGVNYYRIRQVDLDGTESYSVVRSIRLDKDAPAFVVYPNPAHDILNYQLLNAGNVSSFELRLHSMDGRLLKKFNLKNQSGSISVYDLPSGVYIVTMADNKGRIENRKVVVQK